MPARVHLTRVGQNGGAASSCRCVITALAAADAASPSLATESDRRLIDRLLTAAVGAFVVAVASETELVAPTGAFASLAPAAE